MRARRLETLYDTSLCKVLESTRHDSAEDSIADAKPLVGIACRLRQIDGFERASVTLENLLRRKALVIMVIQNEWYIAFYVSWAAFQFGMTIN